MGQTTVRKGRGNSTVSKSIFCVFFFSTYTIILGIHTYIFHNRECDFFKYFFWGGQPSDGEGHVPSVPPGIYAHDSVITHFIILNIKRSRYNLVMCFYQNDMVNVSVLCAKSKLLDEEVRTATFFLLRI